MTISSLIRGAGKVRKFRRGEARMPDAALIMLVREAVLVELRVLVAIRGHMHETASPGVIAGLYLNLTVFSVASPERIGNTSKARMYAPALALLRDTTNPPG
ncbi:hypothetical protein ACWGCW_18765 [Streptomyces sp. NPDC054933]